MSPCTAIEELSALPARRVRAEDSAAVAEMLLRMSDQSRMRRFHSVAPYVSEQDMRLIVDADHTKCEAVAALDDDGRFIAVAQYCEMGDPRTAQIAVVVLDEYQRQGIGRALVGAIMRCARANGYDRLFVKTLLDNDAGMALFSEFGFQPYSDENGVVELRLFA
jgi:GNAT superfamily N-acetyltransferase